MLITKAISDGILQPNDKLPFHKLVRFVSEYFTYDVENSVFFAKNGDKTKAIYLMDIIEQLSIIGIELSPEKLAQATESSKVQKEATLEHLVASLPEWDGIDHIKKFVGFISTNAPDQFESIVKTWMTMGLGMVIEPTRIDAVNRTVLCLQSDKQRLGKTSIARWLSQPFQTSYSTALIEYDAPRKDNDAKLELTKNLIVVVDDIDTWSGSKIEGLKSSISAKEIKVRPPYFRQSIYGPRRASYFATTNQSGFLNESGNTRWAVFNVDAIDWKGYTTECDATMLWAQAKAYWQNAGPYTSLSEQLVEFCLASSESHQIDVEGDNIIAQYVKYCDECDITALEIYQAMADTHRRLLGSATHALSKIGKGVKRLYGESVARKINGRNKYRLKLVQARKDSDFEF
jgi:predicted P-loop ATPase